MNSKAFVGVSILAVVLIVLGSQSNVVGYQTVQTEQRFNQKDLLFQTICDLSKNKEIQKTILESQCKMILNPFPSSELTSFPTINKRQLNGLYFLGAILFRSMGKARIESLIKSNSLTTKTSEKINSVIGSNTQLKEEMAQLTVLNCPSCSDSKFTWHFPIICTILFILFLIGDSMPPGQGLILLILVGIIADELDCYWLAP